MKWDAKRSTQLTIGNITMIITTYIKCNTNTTAIPVHVHVHVDVSVDVDIDVDMDIGIANTVF